MSELFKQIKWQFLIFQKNNLITMIAAMTGVYVLLIYFLKGFGNLEKFITLLIYNDPAVIGFIFIGISIILEKDQEVLPALFVTPLNPHTYFNFADNNAFDSRFSWSFGNGVGGKRNFI